jgi:hypothetical protein
MSGQEAFKEAVTTITGRIAGRNLDGDLQAYLDESFPPGGEAFDDLAELCRQGIAASSSPDRRPAVSPWTSC